MSGAASRANSLRDAMAVVAEFAGKIGTAGQDIYDTIRNHPFKEQRQWRST